MEAFIERKRDIEMKKAVVGAENAVGNIYHQKVSFAPSCRCVRLCGMLHQL